MFGLQQLTHISLASFLWDIGKHNRPQMWRPIWGYSVCVQEFHRKLKKKEILSLTPLKTSKLREFMASAKIFFKEIRNHLKMHNL